MSRGIPLRKDYNSEAIRALARQASDGKQARRLLALSMIYDSEPRQVAAATLMYGMHEIIKRSDTQKGFAVIAKRWIVERTLASISRNRRLARDFENLARTATALVRLAMIKLMLGRLAYT